MKILPDNKENPGRFSAAVFFYFFAAFAAVLGICVGLFGYSNWVVALIMAVLLAAFGLAAANPPKSESS